MTDDTLAACERDLLAARTLAEVRAVRRRIAAIRRANRERPKPDTLAEMTAAFRRGLGVG